MRFWLAIGAAAMLWTSAGAATAQTRYGTWRSGQDRLQNMTEELRRMVDEAARGRAADPRFLDDLRALADRYGNPWPVALVREDFRDGDFTAKPAWTVAAGRFEIDWRGGLRSIVTAPAAPPPQSKPAEPARPAGKVRPEELALRLFGQILNPKDNAPARAAPPPAPVPPPVVPAEIFLAQPFSNAFALTATLRLEAGAGPVTLAVYQGRARRLGYALVAGRGPGLRLQRRGAAGTVTLGEAKMAVLTDNAKHVVRWTRAADGTMIVTLDGKEVLRARDAGFRDRWAGVALTNGGGAATLRALTLFGARS